MIASNSNGLPADDGDEARQSLHAELLFTEVARLACSVRRCRSSAIREVRLLFDDLADLENVSHEQLFFALTELLVLLFFLISDLELGSDRLAQALSRVLRALEAFVVAEGCIDCHLLAAEVPWGVFTRRLTFDGVKVVASPLLQPLLIEALAPLAAFYLRYGREDDLYHSCALWEAQGADE